ncbi:MAG: hypothetical protein K2Q34_07055 [Alphaproteobacteria bacterium]|nr:hypothetical protein [Alphaproteobacteria bacterium]
MKKIYSFVILAALLANPISAHAMDDLEKHVAKKTLFKVVPKTREEAEKLIHPMLKPNKEISEAAKDFFDLVFNPENAKYRESLSVVVWNNLVDHIFGKNEDDQLTTINANHMRMSQLFDRKRKAEPIPPE